MPTADQVAVSVSADFREYDRQTKQSAEAFEAAVNGMARDAENAAASVEASQKRIGAAALGVADKETQAAAKAEAAEQRKERAKAAWILRAQRATAQYIANQEAEARKAEEAAQREAKAAEDASKREIAARNAAALAAKNAAGVASGAVGPTGPSIPYRMRGAASSDNFAFGNRGRLGGAGGATNVSYQLQDIIVQLQGGQAAALVLSQQLPQLLSGFGALGAVAGIAAAGIGLVIPLLFDTETASDRAAAATDSFNTAIKSTAGAISASKQELLNFRDTLSLVQRGYRDLAVLDVEKAIRDNNKVIEDQGTALANAVRKAQAELLTATTSRADISQGMPAQLTEIEEQYSAFLRKLRDERPTNLNQLTDILHQLDTLGPAFEKAGYSVQPLRDAIQGLTGPLDKAAQQQRNLSEVQKEVAATSETSSIAVRLLNGIFGEGVFVYDKASNALKLASFAMDDAGEAASRNGLKIEGFISGLERLANYGRSGGMFPRPTPDTGLQFGNQGAPNPGKPSFGSGDLGAALASLYGETPSGSGGGLPSRPAGFDPSGVVKEHSDAVAKAAERQAAAIDKSNLKIDQEVDLNERLITVYRQGEEARARVKAQYDAEAEARARNLKVGTDQYNSFVAEYKLQAERKRLSDVLLGDYATSDKLIQSVMTSQEKYNKTLEDYNRLREAGALPEEAYQRLIRQLETDTNGYAEGITAIGDAFEQSIRGAQTAEQAIINLTLSLVKLIAQAALLGTGPLSKGFDSIFGTAGGIFNLAGSITGATLGTGGATSVLNAANAATSLLPRADGGQVFPGRGYTVAERAKPEIFFPSVPGQIIPMDRMPGNGGAADTVHVTQYINATGDKQIAAAIQRSSQATLRAALGNSYKKVTTDSRNFGGG
jgi:hypothetical protein